MTIVPLPDTTVQLPVPTAGVLPDIVYVVAQIVCEAPALATVGKLSRIMATVEVDGGHTPLDIVHWRT